MEIVRFIFSSFWVFVGTVILIGTLFQGIAQVIRAIKGTQGTKERS
jgi:hypothetical protein